MVDLDRWEISDQWWFFDQLMLQAARRDAMLIDLRSEVALQGQRSGPDMAVDIDAVVMEVEGAVISRLLDGSDRWWVLQVIAPGGDEDVIPVVDRPLIGGTVPECLPTHRSRRIL